MYLFKTQDGKELCHDDFVDTLKQLGACDCKTLFVHSDVMFGTMNPEIKRREFTVLLLNIFDCLNVGNIIMPAFSYSFNNGKDFDVKESRSLMGTLSEAFRKLEGVYRTIDPICSFAVKGKLAEDFKAFKNENSAFGKNSCYDFLDGQKNVKYLFFGADLADCFTYVHHMEQVLEVPYRFGMTFNGNITDYDGRTYNTDWTIGTQCGGVKLYEKNEHFKKQLIAEHLLEWTAFGDKELSCISQDDARKAIQENIEKDKFYFLERPYTDADLTHEYVMKQDGKPVTHC